MALPPLILLTVVGMEQAWGRVRASWRQRPARLPTPAGRTALSLAFLAGATAYFVLSDKRYYGSLDGWLRYQPLKPSYTAYYVGPFVPTTPLVPLRSARGGGMRVFDFQAIDLDGATEFLTRHTAPTESVFAYPEHAIFNFLADRRSATRFSVAGLAWTAPAWREEILATLQAQPPRIVVRGKPLSNLAQSIHQGEELLPDVSRFLTAQYHLIRQFNAVEILEYDQERTDASSAR
jgi:hypothetical protein